MTSRLPQAPRSTLAVWRTLAAASLVALCTAGCIRRGPADVTGSTPLSNEERAEAWHKQAELWGARFNANPGDATAALNYARALRTLDQKPQAVAVLQQAAIRSPENGEVLAAYGKVLSEVGRLKEAAAVLERAHVPERPDWRILSAQGAVADQMGDHALAQKYYESALRLAPGEPNVLSNLGLSYALSKRLADAERVLREASEHPQADARVRENLALVLGLQGKYADAEDLLKRDLSPEEVANNIAALRGMGSQPKGANAVQRASKKSAPVKPSDDFSDHFHLKT